MKLNLHPDYRVLADMEIAKPDDPETKGDFEAIRKILTAFERPEELEIYDDKVPGPPGAPDVPIRVYRKRNVRNAPIVMNVHGGGFVAGDLNNDNARMAYLAMNIPCIVVSVQYRLSPASVFPDALMDCLAVWNWIHASAQALRGDNTRMGLFGTSAGGNLCAGLAFYLRDHGGPAIRLNALNVPALGIGPTLSAEQMRYGAPVLSGDNLSSAFKVYLGGFDGTHPSYYAVPNFAFDFSGLPPTLLIVGEYDPLRDEGRYYADQLLKSAVPCELYMMPRVGHGFDMVDAPMTKWIREGICASFRREFGIKSV